MAAHSLGDMGSVVAIPRLLELVVEDPATDVREAAARSLGALRATDAVEPLVRALVSGSVPRAIASQALLTIGPAAVPEFRELAGDEDDGVRGRAVELIGLLGGAADADILLARVRDPSAEVRARAARALGRLGADEAAAELREALADRIPYVRASAAIALGQVGDRAAADDLLEQARADAFEPARAAAEALVRIDPDRVRAAARLAGAGPHLTEAADLLAIRA
jgi:HEAT repeat protein